jgi:4-amino-4-deoxy-L-arabinose transferase-like glycosyltransferase
MALSVRAFGLSSWSVMLPQTLETIVALVLLNRAVRRVAGRLAGLVAALVLASTPVVLALARYNDPDTVMTLLVVAAAYCCVRAMDSDRRGWLVATGALLGLAFLSKWAVALLPVPAFVGALVIARHRPVREHVGRLLLVAAAGAVTGFGWVLVVMAVPAGSRPYADSSQGSLLNLIVGKDGFSRLGNGSLGSTPGNPISGTAGPLRLFGAPFSGQVGWLLPLAVALLLIMTVAARGRLTAAQLLFGGWLLTTASAFSLMSGSMHPYYAILLAPAASAVIGIGVADLRRRGWLAVATLLAVASVVYGITVALAYGLPSVVPWTAGLLCLAALGAGLLLRARPGRTTIATVVPAALMAGALFVSPVAFGLSTVTHPVTGADPLAGPTAIRPPAAYPAALMAMLLAHRGGSTWLAAVPHATAAGLLELQSRVPVLPLGGFTGHSGAPTLSQVQAWVAQDRLRYLVLNAGYTTYPNDTPPDLRGYPIAPVLQWAGRIGCPHLWPDSRMVVIDLEEGRCPR